MTVHIDTDSPAGSWRAALEANGYCRACKQRVCDHPDLVYQGLVPASGEPVPWLKEALDRDRDEANNQNYSVGRGYE